MGLIPTAVPQLDGLDMLNVEASNFNSTLFKRALAKREIPPDGSGDWKDWYKTLEADTTTTHKIVNEAETAGTLASWVRYRWGNAPQNGLVRDLYGCEYIHRMHPLQCYR
jgi:hypothetical protein